MIADNISNQECFKNSLKNTLFLYLIFKNTDFVISWAHNNTCSIPSSPMSHPKPL